MSFQGASPAPLRIPSRLDPLDALEELFTAALEPVRDNIKEGVVRAIREWDPQYYSLNVLDRLCWASERLRVTDAIPHMAEFLRLHAQRGLLKDGADDIFEVADDLLSILVGFTPDRMVEELCSELLYDDRVSHRHASLLAVGICKTTRARFVEAFNQFMIRRETEPEYFDAIDVPLQFVQTVSPQLVAAEHHKLRSEGQEFLLMIGVDDAEIPQKIAETQQLVSQSSPRKETYGQGVLRNRAQRRELLPRKRLGSTPVLSVRGIKRDIQDSMRKGY